MGYRLAADAVVLVHLVFVGFVVGGGFLAWRWPRLAWIHVPAAAWGTAIEFTGWICPLTPLETGLRRAAGDQGYSGGFVEHYIIPILYPVELTAPAQILLGILVLVLNVFAYSILLRRRLSQASR